MFIESKHNERIKRIASLKDRKSRLEYGEYLVEGVKMVSEAVKYHAVVKCIIGKSELVYEYQNCGIEIIETTDAVLNFISDAITPQGIVAVLEIPNNKNILNTKRSVYLDGVSDPGNLGTIIRTLVASGIKRIYVGGGCDPYSPKVVRSSMSGIFLAEIVSVTPQEFFENKIENLIAADMGGENVFDFKTPESFCLMLGSEAHGLSQLAKEKADYTVAIPMNSLSESLNVGVACGILVYTLTHGLNN